MKELIAKMADSLPIAYIASVDNEGYPCTKACIYFCDQKGFSIWPLSERQVLMPDDVIP